MAGDRESAPEGARASTAADPHDPQRHRPEARAYLDITASQPGPEAAARQPSPRAPTGRPEVTSLGAERRGYRCLGGQRY